MVEEEPQTKELAEGEGGQDEYLPEEAGEEQQELVLEEGEE